MEVSRHWRLQGQRYGLTGAVCTECGKRFFSPRPVCDSCHTTTSKIYHFNEKFTAPEPMRVFEPAQK